MTDYKALIEEHSCKPNQGCGVMTICMCGVAEDMADEIERLRNVIKATVRYLENMGDPKAADMIRGELREDK